MAKANENRGGQKPEERELNYFFFQLLLLAWIIFILTPALSLMGGASLLSWKILKPLMERNQQPLPD